MRTALRPVLSVLLVVLLTTWGTCPCVFAKMLRGSTDEAAQEAAPARTCACCRQKAKAPESPPPVSRKPCDDCPCCKSGGWMRDLPPQAQDAGPALEAPVGLDLPAPALAPLATVAPLRLPRADEGPPPRPSAHRPHAAPIGIVRLLA